VSYGWLWATAHDPDDSPCLLALNEQIASGAARLMLRLPRSSRSLDRRSSPRYWHVASPTAEALAVPLRSPESEVSSADQAD